MASIVFEVGSVGRFVEDILCWEGGEGEVRWRYCSFGIGFSNLVFPVQSICVAL